MTDPRAIFFKNCGVFDLLFYNHACFFIGKIKDNKIFNSLTFIIICLIIRVYVKRILYH